MNMLWSMDQETDTSSCLRKVETPLYKDMVQVTIGGCGGMYSYFLGVATIIQKYFEIENVIFSGSSAGCFPSLLLALNLNIEKEFKNFHFNLLKEARNHPMKSFGRWIPLVKKHLLNTLDPNAYKKANGRFYCSITKVRWLKNEIVSHWKNMKK